MKKNIYSPTKQAFLLLICLFSLASSCNKNDDTQPQLHEDIVRCKVNGVEWEAFDYTEGDIGGWGTGATDLQYYKDTRFFEMRTVRKLEDQSINQSINFYTPDIHAGANTIPYRVESFKDWLNESGCIFYNLDSLNTRVLTINKLDTVNFIIIGEFEFSAINNCQDTVHITDGYFDLQYRF